MSLAISKARFKQFLNQARGANVMEVHVNRQNKRNAVVLKYNGKAPKMKTRVTAEWTIPRGELDDAAIDAAIKEFLGMLRKHRLVSTRLVIETVDERIRRELHQIAPTDHVFRQKNQVKPTMSHVGAGAVGSITRCDVGLDPEDRLDPGRSGGIVELDRGVEIAVIGDRDRIHAALTRSISRRTVIPPSSNEYSVWRWR